jgi:Uma2 family endonuclease
MSATIPIAKIVSQMQLEPGSVVTIPNVNWQEFESILQELGQKRAARVAYSQSNLQIMVPLPEHELPSDLISDIVRTLLKAKGIPYQPFDSTTFKQEGAAGVEPDACFYIQNYERMIGREQLQPNDPPPDLAIETEVTSITALNAYEAIQVPELWVYESNHLTIYLLQDGKYVKSDTSPTFPDLPLTQIIPYVVQRGGEVGNLQALEEFLGS